MSSAGGTEAAFVGRESELATLAEALARVDAGRSRFIFVEGAAGIGKTTLVRRFLQQRNIESLRATADEAESRLPFSVVTQLLVEVPDPPPALRAITSSSDPLTVGAAVLDAIGNLQRQGPLALVLDDAQWCDRASVTALTFAFRRLRVDRVLTMVLAPENEALPEQFRRLRSDDRSDVVTVAGLDPVELRQLAASTGRRDLPRRAIERLWRHTGGHPLHARALLEELASEALRHTERLPAPRSFAVLVLGRLAACSQPAQELVSAASVLGDRCPLGLAAEVGNVPGPLAALEEAIAADVLEEVSGGAGIIAFKHPLVRAAVYHDLGPTRRSAVHLRAAAVLAPPASLDHRVAAAAGPDAGLAADLETFAQGQATEGSTASAAAHLLAAARFTPDPGHRERLLLMGGDLLLAAGEVTEVLPLVPALQHLPRSSRRNHLLGQLAFNTGDQQTAERLLLDAAHHAEPDDHGVLVQAALTLALLYSIQDRPEESVTWARRAIEATDERAPQSAALWMLVGELAVLGRAAEGLALVVHLDADQVSETEMAALMSRGVVRLWTDDVVGARADLEAVTVARSPRPVSREVMLALGYLAQAEYYAGAWDDSMVHGDLAVSLAEDSEQLWLGAFVHAMAAWALAPQGAWDLAGAHARAATEAAGLVGDAGSVGHAATAAAHVAFCRGNAEGVIEAVGPILRLSRRVALDEPGVMPWREPYLDALVSLGRLGEAESLLDSFEAVAADRGRRSCLAAAARTRGGLAAARGQRDAAAEAFETACLHVDGLGMPFHDALINDAYGRFLRRTGERRKAAAHLRLARDNYELLAARPFLERVDRELAACGLRPTSRHPVDPGRLTPQELAVARLVASGLTNRQAAAELVVTVKTVEYHLGNVFAKLDVRSRTQLSLRLAGDT